VLIDSFIFPALSVTLTVTSYEPESDGESNVPTYLPALAVNTAVVVD